MNNTDLENYIARVEQRVMAIETTVKTFTTTMESLTETLKGLNSNSAELKGLDSKIALLNRQVNDLKKVNYIGDKECSCPPELANGYEGYAHRVPIDCSTTPNEIVRDCEEHIKSCKERIKVLTKLRAKTKKHN